MSAPKLRFGEFDGDWELTKLENKIDFLAGYAFDSKLMSNDVQSYQLIKMSNVYQNKLDITRNPSYWKILDKKIEKFLLSKGDIVLTLTGTVGKTDYGYNVEITEENKFILNQRLVRLRGKLDKSNSKFIQHRISTDRFFYHFFNSSKGGTGNQSNVSIEDLKLLELPFPSLQEQTKIANFLSAVDEKINQLTLKHALLSQYKQGIMQKLFSQQIRFKADDGGEFGEWEDLKICDLVRSLDAGVSVNSEDIKPTNDEYSVLKTSCISSGYFDENERKRVLLEEEINRLKEPVLDNSILMSRMNTPLLVGMNAYVEKAPKNTYLPDRLWQLKINADKVLTRWLAFYLGSENGLSQIKDLASGTSNSMKNIKKSDVLNLEIFVPSKEEQTKIANFLSAVDQKIEVVALQIKQAKQWKKGLLQQMFV